MIVSHRAKGNNVKSFCAAIERVAAHMPVEAYLEWPFPMRDLNMKNVTVHYQALEAKDIDPTKVVVYATDEVLFAPDALLLAAQMLGFADYVCGYDAPSTQLVSVQFVGSRWWKVPGTMTRHFVAMGSTILQDALIVKEYDDTAWKLLRLVHGRRCASPMPSIWQLEGAPVSPGVPWESLR